MRFQAIHNVVIDNILYVDVFVIAKTMTVCAREWFEDVKDTARFKGNYVKFVGYRRWSLPPDIGMEHAWVIG